MIRSLDGDWLLAPDPENFGRERDWRSSPAPAAVLTRVPGVIQEAFPAYHGVAWYWKEFAPPPASVSDGRALIRFDAADYFAEVWLNGVRVGSHEGGETPFALDVTEAIRFGVTNLLAVRIVNPTNDPIDGMILAETPHANRSIPHYVGGAYDVGGLRGSVSIMTVPAVRATDLFVHSDFRSGEVRMRASLLNAGPDLRDVTARVAIEPSLGGESFAETEISHAALVGESEIEFRFRLDDPHPWDIDDPHLYRASIEIVGEDGSHHRMSTRFGLRDFRVEKGYFRLNGRRVFLKSSHTGNHCPAGVLLPPASAPDLLRRDLLYAKSSGFNMIRFIAGMAHSWELDLCDELGLMVYEESLAAWLLKDSPQMANRFDRSLREMVLRDRNHPSIVIWGLLNETEDNPVFRRAAISLPLLRSLDDSRLVLLGSGRWDGDLGIGSICNPGESDWEHQWGEETPNAGKTAGWDPIAGGLKTGMGDLHAYPQVPHTPEIRQFIRTVGEGSKPVFLSEYGIGSMMNVIDERARYDQRGLSSELEDAALLASMAEKLRADWRRYGMEDAYPDPETLLRESQRRHVRQRLLGFDLIRSNPKICGFNLTGLLDHGMTGEGLWTFWREFKPGIMDALRDGWSPLRWCLFAEPSHGYAGKPIRLEAVLANEDVLPPGEYPVHLRVVGPAGLAWEKRVILFLPKPDPGEDPPLAVTAFKGEAILDGPSGSYEFSAELERGGAPDGGRLKFRVSSPVPPLAASREVVAWGLENSALRWLSAHGVHCRDIRQTEADRPAVLLIGDVSGASNEEDWKSLMGRVSRGSVAAFLSPYAFRRGDDSVGWLPLENQGRGYEFNDWLYHKECVAGRHPIFDGLSASGILDWEDYGPILPHFLFDGLDAPDETAVAAFAAGYSCPGGYASGLIAGSYRCGRGAFLLNSLKILESLDAHPAADRLLLNVVEWAASRIDS